MLYKGELDLTINTSQLATGHTWQQDISKTRQRSLEIHKLSSSFTKALHSQDCLKQFVRVKPVDKNRVFYFKS